MSDKSTAATPRPWEHPFDGKIRQLGDTEFDNGVIAFAAQRLTEGEREANAELIVRAVNSHDKLLAAAKAVSELGMVSFGDNTDSRPSWFTNDYAWKRWVEVSEQLRAAIAEADLQP